MRGGSITSVSYYTSRAALWGTRSWLVTGDRRMCSLGRKTPTLRKGISTGHMSRLGKFPLEVPMLT